MASNPEQTWLKDAIIYNVLIDRFARGNGEAWLNADDKKPVFCGGNLQGVMDKLDYLQELGINTILLTPFHPTPAYHGYHVLDFYGVDERFGTIETLKKLLAEAHKRNMRVVMDFVLNHVSVQHPYFVDARKKENSEYKKWFHFTKWPDEYVSFLNYYELPKLELKNPEVKAHVINAALQWVDLGFDGLRLDHVVGVNHPFLHELRSAVKRHNPQCMLIGESAVGRMSWSDLQTLRIKNKLLLFIFSQLRINTNFFLQLQYRKDLDGVFDFFFRDMAEAFIVKKTWYKPRWLFNFILKTHYAFYPKRFSPIPLLDNIDLDRFSFHLQGNKAQLKEAATIQFNQPQPVMMLYGNETGIKQLNAKFHASGHEKPHGDVEIRALMPWDAIDEEMLGFYKELIKKRKMRIIG